MEARWLAILWSHLRPCSSPAPTRPVPVSRSSCDSGSNTGQQHSDSDKGNPQNDCVFCKVIRGEAFKLYEDDVCLCILDTNPLSRGKLSSTLACLKMEARRLATLFSHLRLFSSPTPAPTQPVSVSRSSCDPGSNTELQRSDSDKGNLQNNCVFCKIIRGELPALKLYEDDVCLCILDARPLSRGHSLIIPKSHFSSLNATPPDVVAAMCSNVPSISNAIMKATGSDSFNLLVNNGAAAGQVIFHTHIHIIPRKALDGLWASETWRRPPLTVDQEAYRLVDCVREQLSLSDDSEDIKVEGSTLTGN